jgi:hypothetical protein
LPPGRNEIIQSAGGRGDTGKHGKMKERETLESCLGTEKAMKRQMRKKRHQSKTENSTNEEIKKEGSQKDIGKKI